MTADGPGRNRRQVRRFGVADAWDVCALQKAMPEGESPHLLLLDVGGISSSYGVLDALALVRLVCSTFKDTLEVVVVKSHGLHAAARALKPVGWGGAMERVGSSSDAAAAVASRAT